MQVVTCPRNPFERNRNAYIKIGRLFDARRQPGAGKVTVHRSAYIAQNRNVVVEMRGSYEREPAVHVKFLLRMRVRLARNGPRSKHESYKTNK
jgi:hypothetical protein